MGVSVVLTWVSSIDSSTTPAPWLMFSQNPCAHPMTPVCRFSLRNGLFHVGADASLPLPTIGMAIIPLSNNSLGNCWQHEVLSHFHSSIKSITRPLVLFGRIRAGDASGRRRLCAKLSFPNHSITQFENRCCFFAVPASTDDCKQLVFGKGQSLPLPAA